MVTVITVRSTRDHLIIKEVVLLHHVTTMRSKQLMVLAEPAIPIKSQVKIKKNVNFLDVLRRRSTKINSANHVTMVLVSIVNNINVLSAKMNYVDIAHAITNNAKEASVIWLKWFKMHVASWAKSLLHWNGMILSIWIFGLLVDKMVSKFSIFTKEM